ncbi:MAG: FIG137478: Hypothetical protein [uncultured Campylobacterales bacterium]|uniref:Uncharacterized protein n=1 Tax=uncultured Campylobacterales bacterium TaxID=352960 RepID=A0A6S6SPL2_9BACT|nr:MAG: FIG137478: Hypothetical protein [uncultured Campylobacterales bacterium]
MNQHLQKLVELSSIDKEMSSYNPKIEEANKELEISAKNFDEISNQIQKLEDSNKDLLVKISKNESYIDELGEKLEKKKVQSASLKTEKEIQSINIEIDIAKEQINFANEEIARFENYIESNAKEVETLKEQVQGIEDEFKNKEKETARILEDIEKSKAQIQTKRDKIKSDVNVKVFSFYESIRKWAGDSAIVPVKRKACYGCHLVINEQTYSAVLLSDELITCQSCGRIIYLPEE